MNGSVSCLTPERLRQLSADELSPPELEELEEHVTHCENCRCALEMVAAESGWRQEVRDALTDVSSPAGWSALADSYTDDGPHDGCGAVEEFLKLLGPTDDPRMLGRIGPYEIVGILGRGGMGVVFKGFDGALNRYVAIKMLLPHLAASGAARKRFAREAQAAAAVVHDHVMAIHSVAEWQGVPYLVMPYGRGVSLQKRLSDRGPLEVREILRIGMQTAAGLAAAHSQGLVHRDVKPANILLDDGVERVTLTDFGLARAVDDASLTRVGVLAGTPQYMSPEQARGQTVDARSDLFSLGSVLYAMCTGRPPFRADSSYGVLRLISDDESSPVREINPEIPQWLCQIIDKLMAKQPADRYESAAQVASLLEACLAHVQQPTVAKLPASLRPQAKGRFFSISRRWSGVIAMIAALGLGLLGVFAWQATEAPDIAGKWSGPEWGEVVLAEKQPGEYAGTYTDTFKEKPGTIEVQWSRLEGRYKGTWREGLDRAGKISLRLVDDEIRGAWTTSKKSGINPGTPELADLTWKRSSTDDLHPNPTLAQEAKTDKELLQGAWLLVEAYKYGKKFDESEKDLPVDLWPHQLVITGNKLVQYFTRRGQLTGGQSPNARFDLEPTKNPKEINIDWTSQEWHAIYKLEGDTLTICWEAIKLGNTDSIRPDTFRTAADSERILRVYKRVHPIDVSELAAAAKQFNVDTAQVRKELFTPPIPDLTVERLREGFRQTADLYRRQGKHQVADALQKIAESGRLPKEASALIATGTYAQDEAGQIISRQVVPGFTLPDDNASGRLQLIVLQPLELIYRKDGPASKDYGDHFDGKNGEGSQATERHPKLQGIVMDLIDQELTEISLGADDGLRKGDTLSVFRDKTHLSKLTVVRVAANKSVARIESRKGDIRRGDVVATETPPEAPLSPATAGALGAPSAVTQIGGGGRLGAGAGPQVSAQLFVQQPGEARMTLKKDKEGEKSIRIPGRFTVATGQTLRGILSKIPKYGELELAATVEMAAISRETRPFLEHNSIPLIITGEDIDQAASGNLVTKVIYLPNPENAESPTAGVETLVTQRLDPGVDPITAAQQRGAILAVLRLGNRTEEPIKEDPKPLAPKRLRQFSIQHRVNAIACSPDGKLIAIAKPDPDEGGTILYLDGKRLVQILSAETGKTVVPLRLTTDEEDALLAATERVPAFEVTALAFSPDGNLVAVGTSVGQVKLYSARTGELVQSLDDEKARQADKATPEKFKSLARAMGDVRSLAFSPDGSLLAMAGSSFEDVAGDWERVERGGLGRSFTGPGRLKVWDAKTGALKHDLAGHSHAFGVAFSPHGPWLASARRWSTASSDGNGMLLWDLEKGAIHRTIAIEANGATHSVAFSPTKKLAAIGSVIFDKENDTSSTAIRVAYPLSGITQWQQTIQGAAMPKAFLPDGKSFVVLCGRKSVRFIDAETGHTRHEIQAADSALWIDLAIAPKAGILVVAGAAEDPRGSVEIWDVAVLGGNEGAQ